MGILRTIIKHKYRSLLLTTAVLSSTYLLADNYNFIGGKDDARAPQPPLEKQTSTIAVPIPPQPELEAVDTEINPLSDNIPADPFNIPDTEQWSNAGASSWLEESELQNLENPTQAQSLIQDTFTAELADALEAQKSLFLKEKTINSNPITDPEKKGGQPQSTPQKEKNQIQTKSKSKGTAHKKPTQLINRARPPDGKPPPNVPEFAPDNAWKKSGEWMKENKPSELAQKEPETKIKTQTKPLDDIPAGDGEYTAFDVFVGGNLYGLSFGHFGENWFEIDNPQEFLNILPDIQNKDALLPLISGKIVNTRTIDNLGTATVSPQEFRIDIEIAKEQALASAVEDLDTLPPPENKLSLINKVVLTGSSPLKDFSSLDNNITRSHNTIVGYGATRLQATGSHSKAAGYEVTGALIEHDMPWLDQQATLTGGLLQTHGQRFARSLDIMGFRFASNERLLNRDSLFNASHIEVYLRSRSKVEIFKGSEAQGRTLFSQILDFGNVEIDTRSFPDGTYDIEIVVTEDGEEVDRETRTFVKSRELAPRKYIGFRFEAGVTRDKLDSTDSLAMLFEMEKRLTGWADGTASLYVTDETSVLEGSVRTHNTLQRFGFKGFVKTELTAGIKSDAKPSGVEGIVTFDAGNYQLRMGASRSYDAAPGLNAPAGSLALQKATALNLSFSKPLEFWGLSSQFTFDANWRKTSGGDERYAYGPELSVNLTKGSKYDSKLKLRYTATERDKQALMSLVVKHNDDVWQKQAQATYNHTKEDGSYTDTSATLAFNGSAQRYSDWRKGLATRTTVRSRNLGADDRDEAHSLDTHIRYKGDNARVNTYLTKNLSEGNGQIGGELISTTLWSKDGGFSASSENLNKDSALLSVKLNGPENSKIALHVNNSVKGYGYGGDTIYTQLPIYKTSEVSLHPVEDDDMVSLRNNQQYVTAYPGNVMHREFDIVKVAIIIGRLLGLDGSPLVDTEFETKAGKSFTDAEGYFAIEQELAENEDFSATTPDGKTCEQVIERSDDPEQALYDLRDVICR